MLEGMFEGIQHVGVTVDDLEAARAFYGGQLGLAELPRPDFGFPGLWYAIGDQALHLMELGPADPSTPNHLAVQVADLDAVVAVLESRGVTVRVSERVTPGAGRQATVRDPAGNTVELNQPLP